MTLVPLSLFSELYKFLQQVQKRKYNSPWRGRVVSTEVEKRCWRSRSARVNGSRGRSHRLAAFQWVSSRNCQIDNGCSVFYTDFFTCGSLLCVASSFAATGIQIAIAVERVITHYWSIAQRSLLPFNSLKSGVDDNLAYCFINN